MVHDKAAGAFVPGVRPFDDPALGQDDKALGFNLDGKEFTLAGMPKFDTFGRLVMDFA